MKIYHEKFNLGGVALGKAFRFQKKVIEVDENVFSSPNIEWKRFLIAQEDAAEKLQKDKFEHFSTAYTIMLSDLDFVDFIHIKLFKDKLTAESAIVQAAKEFGKIFSDISVLEDDKGFFDLEELAYKLINFLPTQKEVADLKKEEIFIAPGFIVTSGIPELMEKYRLKPYETVIFDGKRQKVFVNPDLKTIEKYKKARSKKVFLY